MNHGSVLVVDDNVDAADLLVTMLSLSGWTAKGVYSGVEALVSIAQSLPDVVLLDIGMPGMSGITVAERLRAKYGARCPILVALTAWSDSETKRACLAAGMSLHLTKPIEFEALTLALDRVMVQVLNKRISLI